MYKVSGSDVEFVSVKAIEGQSVYGGDLRVRPLIGGDEMMCMEIHYDAGVGAPAHIHSHESIVYVIKGRVKTLVGDDEYILAAGDACRHPAGVAHTVEAIEESVMLEIKAPAPEMMSFFKL